MGQQIFLGGRRYRRAARPSEACVGKLEVIKVACKNMFGTLSCNKTRLVS